jgi:hypothetical protein
MDTPALQTKLYIPRPRSDPAALVISSRVDPNLSLARLRAYGQLH